MISRERTLVPTTFLLIAAVSLLLGGCLQRKLKPLNPCLVSGVSAEIAITNIDKIDILFMIDDSGSMAANQSQLRDQFPKLIQTLTTGHRAGTDASMDFPPANDLHLGVVTSDLGLIGIPDVMGCKGLGDDGILRNTPSPRITGCAASYPMFISYKASDGIKTPAQTATDFSCIADVGTAGCGFEQQLESPLKALWPSMQPAPAPGQMPPPVPIFVGDPAIGKGLTGHGDLENAGFLRNDATMGLSLIAIIVVTDEEDCSTGDKGIFTPPDYLQDGDPLKMQDLNLRCFFNPMSRYPLTRYLNGFRALRPGAENLVIFGAITGVPPDLVSPDKIKTVNFDDKVARDKFYDDILNDPRMQETVDPNRTHQEGGNLIPSCKTTTGRAYPPRRITELAKMFGPSGIVQSICQQDFGPAMDAIIAIIAKQLGAVCLPRPLVRNAQGEVPCNVVWELPKVGTAPTDTPTTCTDPRYPFLSPPEAGHDTTSKKGGAICQVQQLAVMGPPGMLAPVPTDGFMDGWYYDTFSDELKKGCLGASKQRVAFTKVAKPPTGVTVKLECLNETQNLANTRVDVNTAIDQPEIGDACENVTLNGMMLTGDAACEVRLTNGKSDASMFCHPQLKVCVLGCKTSADCAAGWECDDRPETLKATQGASGNPNGKPYCVNPTCGSK